MPNREFAARLRSLLKSRHLTLADVAQAVGKSPQTVHKWTRGGNIEYDTLRVLANFLDVNWVLLRWGEEAMASVCEGRDAIPSAFVDVIESESRMAQVIAGLGCGVWEQDCLRNRVFWDAASWKILTGTDRPAAWVENGMERFLELVVEEDRAAAISTLERVLSNPGTSRYLLRFRAKAKPERWVLGVATPVTDVNGRLIKLVGINRYETGMRECDRLLEG